MLQSRTWLLGIGTNMGDFHSYIKMYIVHSFVPSFNAHPIETWMLPSTKGLFKIDILLEACIFHWNKDDLLRKVIILGGY